MQYQVQWDPYLEKQLNHLVVQLDFDFESIAQELQTICKALNRRAVSQADCQLKWTTMHQERSGKQPKRKPQNIMLNEDPQLTMSVDELIERLPQSRRNQDFLNVAVNQFNVLKESVRGEKDEQERQRQQKEKEALFLAQLESIQGEQESEKPLVFKANYDEFGQLLLAQKELTPADVNKVLSQRIDIGKGVQPIKLVDDEYVSQFAVKPAQEVAKIPQENDEFQISENVDDVLQKLDEIQIMPIKLEVEELPEKEVIPVVKLPKVVKFQEDLEQKFSEDEEDEEDYIQSQRYQVKDEKPPQKIEKADDDDLIEEELSVPEPQFDQGKKFRDQLLKEQKDREERKRQEQLKEIEEIERRIQQREEQQAQQRQQAQQAEIERKTQEIALKRKQEEEKQKQEEYEQLDKRLRQYEEEYRQSQLAKIDHKNQEIINELSNYKMRSLFNPSVSYLSQLPCIDQDTQTRIMDLNEYEKSRDGITNRFQILVFPYLDNVNFQAEFFSYFLMNSNLRKSNGFVGYGFPFQLVSFFIGSELKDIFDGHEEVFCPNYVKKQNISCHRYLYMFFDTHVGRGHQILSLKIEQITLQNILTSQTLSKLEYPGALSLTDFSISHIKQMSEISRAFFKLFTMHQLNGEQDETSLIIIREYIEVVEEHFINENSTMKSTLAIETGYASATYVPKAVKSNLNYLLQQINRHNIRVVGMKVVYLTQQNHSELQGIIESLQLKVQQPLIVVALQGHNLGVKLSKLVGSEDPEMAAQIYPNSVNALYHHDKKHSVWFPAHQNMSQKLISYFFGGRLTKVTTLDQIKKLDGLVKEDIKYFTGPTKTPTIFMLERVALEQYCLFVSPQLGVNNYGKFVKYLQKKGFQLEKVISGSKEEFKHLFENLSKLNEKMAFFQTQIDGNPRNESSNILIIFCTGHSISNVRRNFLQKHIDYNFMIHPSKKSLINAITKPSHLQVVQHQLQLKYQFESHLTVNKNFKHFLVAINQMEHLGAVMTTLNEKNLEFLGIFQMQYDSYNVVRNSLYDSLNLSQTSKRRKEPSQFCDRIMDHFQNSTLIFYRYQQQTSEQLIASLKKNPHFLHSNLHVDETSLNKHIDENVLIMEIDPTQYVKLYDLCDDITLKDSFIFDLPSNESKVLKSFVMLDEQFVKSLSLGGVLKSFERQSLTVQLILLSKVPNELEINILDGLSEKLSLTALNDLEKHNLHHFIKQELTKRVQSNRFYLFVTEKENAIFETKQIIQDLTAKYALLSKEDIESGLQDVVKFQLSHGVYCSVDYEASLKELEIIKRLTQSYLVRPIVISQEPLQQKLVMCLFSNNLTKANDLYDLMSDIQSVQIRVDEISHFLVSPEELRSCEAFTTVFSDKFSKEGFGKFLNKFTNDIQLTLMLLDISKLMSVSDYFGSSRISNDGDWSYQVQGKLIKRGTVELYVFTYQNQKSIQNFKATWFS